jgi:transposase-like protein
MIVEVCCPKCRSTSNVVEEPVTALSVFKCTECRDRHGDEVKFGRNQMILREVEEVSVIYGS